MQMADVHSYFVRGGSNQLPAAWRLLLHATWSDPIYDYCNSRCNNDRDPRADVMNEVVIQSECQSPILEIRLSACKISVPNGALETESFIS